MSALLQTKPSTLAQLRESGWRSRSVKQEMRENFTRMLAADEPLYPGIVGYEDTVIPEINIALLAGHDMLFLGEKGQAKSRLMRSLVRFLDEELPYLAVDGIPVHEDPYAPITDAESDSWLSTLKIKFRSLGGLESSDMRND